METFRQYGNEPFHVVVHGGPGAAGEVAPIARELGQARGVLEPFQAAATYTFLRNVGILPGVKGTPESGFTRYLSKNFQQFNRICKGGGDPLSERIIQIHF